MKQTVKPTAAFFLSIVSALAAVIAIAFAVKSSSASYKMAHEMQILVTLGIAAVLFIAAAVASSKLPELVLDVIRLAALVAVGFSFSYIFTDRTSLLGFTYFSSLAAGNTAAMDAMNAALVTMVCQVLTMVLTSVSGFFSLKPRTKA